LAAGGLMTPSAAGYPEMILAHKQIKYRKDFL